MPKNRKPLSVKPVKNWKVKIRNDEFETRTVLIPHDLVPCGPAFAYDEVRKEVINVTVNGYHSELIEGEGGYFYMRLYGYRCNKYNLSNYEKNLGFWPPHEIYPTKAEAERQTKFTAVDLPNEVYQKALGVNKKGERIQSALEECDLPTCCANLSDVRDQLAECMKRKGLEKWRIDLIRDFLQGSHPEFLEERPVSSFPLSNLDKILDALGILERNTK